VYDLSALCGYVYFFPLSNISLQKFTRPAGSFRFRASRFPGDIDIYEYLHFEARDKQAALAQLADMLKELAARIKEASKEGAVYWSQLKAGKDQGGYLNWSLQDVCTGEKLTSSGEMKSLEAALAEGHVTGTCKLDIFARIKDPTNCWAQADWAEAIERYFEVTNVWRCGFIDPENSKVHPITHDVDVARAVEKGLDDYSSRHPVSLKYCKRLWERSVFLCTERQNQRGRGSHTNVGVLADDFCSLGL